MSTKSFFLYVNSKFESLQSSGKLYIVPTRSGFLFASTALIIITIGTIYTNNSILLLGFLLLSLFLVHIFSTHYNLKGFTVNNIRVPSHFADEKFHVTVNCHNLHKSKRFSIKLKIILSDKSEFILPLESVEKSEYQVQHIPLSLSKRGSYQVCKYILLTSYPMGLFYTWSPVEFTTIFNTFPKPYGLTILNDSQLQNLDELSQVVKNEGEFSEHKKYTESDSPNRIDWKVYAKKQDLVVKSFVQGDQVVYHLNYNDIDQVTFEEKLSQLALWIKEVYELNYSWSLTLPQLSLDSDKGHSHYIKSLTALAKSSSV